VSPRLVALYSEGIAMGGAERVILQLLEGLDRRRFRPVLLHAPNPGIEPMLVAARDQGVETVAMPPLGTDGLAVALSFVTRLRRLGPSVFHAQLTGPRSCRTALAAASVARTETVIATAHLFVDLPFSLAERCCQRVLTSGVDRFLAVSEGVADGWRRTFFVPRRRVEVVHNGVDPRPFDPSRATARPGAPKVVLCVARLDGQKGLGDLVSAAALVEGAEFRIAGEGPERPRIEEQIRRLGLGSRVRLLGFRRDIPELLHDSDVFVLPSHYEGLPLAVLEAMAAEKPVVATRVPGTSDVVRDGETGLLTRPSDPPALAAALRDVLADPVRARRMGAAGRDLVLRAFSVDAMVRRVEAAYADALAPTRRGFFRRSEISGSARP
jgi:glycosyltransferase involved in cell wall biosynthesis